MSIRKRRFTLILLLAAAAVARFPALEADEMGSAFTYQGKLTDGGVPVDGTCDLRFELYANPTGGTALGAVNTPNVAVTEGRFTVALDFGADAFDGTARYLAVSARCPAGSGLYVSLGPRQELRPVPYALFAPDAGYQAGAGLILSPDHVFSVEFAGSGSASTVARSDHDHDARYVIRGEIGSVTGAMIADDAVTSQKIADNSVQPSDVAFNYAASSSKGGPATDLACSGCVGTTDIAQNAVTSQKIADNSIQPSDVAFDYAGSSSKGGPATDLACSGCVGTADIAAGSVTKPKLSASGGSDGQVLSTDGSTLLWTDLPGGGLTLPWAGSTSTSGAAFSVENTGSGIAISGQTASGTGVGGYTAGSGSGVYALADGSGPALRAEARGDGYAADVLGSSSAQAALHVQANGATYAAVFDGDVTVNGYLSKSAGGFRIDHPLDPEHYYLNHSFVESSAMLDIYSGTVTLGPDGSAWVELPDWFEALNTDIQYQLTPVGAAAPDLHVAEEVHDHRFRIAGGHPGLTVSWQVTGVRHDRWAREHRLPVEEPKD